MLFALAFGTRFELYWDEAAVAGIENPDGLLRFGLVLGLPLAGAIFASCQALVLRGRGVGLGAWILSGPLGFAAPILVVWPLAAIWGDIPGPVEPFFIVGGGLLATAAFQWRQSDLGVRGTSRGGPRPLTRR